MQMVSNSKRVVNKTGEELNGSAVPSKISNFEGAEKGWSGKIFDKLILFQVVQNQLYTNKISAE